MKDESMERYQEELDDQWDNRDLGASIEHTQRSENPKPIDESVGLSSVTLRLPEETFRALEGIAKSKGLTFKAYIRRILMDHVESKRVKDSE